MVQNRKVVVEVQVVFSIAMNCFSSYIGNYYIIYTYMAYMCEHHLATEHVPHSSLRYGHCIWVATMSYWHALRY